MLLLILIPLFFIPAFVLPKNKIKFYSTCFSIAGISLILFFLLSFLFGWDMENRIGSVFLGWLPSLFERSDLNEEEIKHLYFCFFCLAMFFVIYLIPYILFKIFFIGKNPDINKPSRKMESIIDIVFFLISTYGMLFLFLVEIREIIPLREGFLSFLFDWIYHIGA